VASDPVGSNPTRCWFRPPRVLLVLSLT
jgi:hypothetical protein